MSSRADRQARARARRPGRDRDLRRAPAVLHRRQLRRDHGDAAQPRLGGLRDALRLHRRPRRPAARDDPPVDRAAADGGAALLPLPGRPGAQRHDAARPDRRHRRRPDLPRGLGRGRVHRARRRRVGFRRPRAAAPGSRSASTSTTCSRTRPPSGSPRASASRGRSASSSRWSTCRCTRCASACSRASGERSGWRSASRSSSSGSSGSSSTSPRWAC